MPNENDGRNPASGSNDKSIAKSPSPPISEQDGKVADPSSQDPNNAIAETRKKLHWLEKANITGQLILAIVGIVALYIYHGQLDVMQRQLDATDRPWIENHPGFAYGFSPQVENGILEHRLFRIGEAIPTKSLVLSDSYLSFTDAN